MDPNNAPQGSQPDALQAQLQQVEQMFPPGLKADTPYQISDMIWQGPFPSDNARTQLIRNPITGMPTPMAPGSSPELYLQAVNALAQAKARAKANVLRGWGAQQAANEALARAHGVNPAAVQGMPGQEAAGVIQGQVATRREQQGNADRQMALQDRRDARQSTIQNRAAEQQNFAGQDLELAGQVAQVTDPEQAARMFQQALALKTKQKEQEVQQRQMQQLPGALSELDKLPPEQAAMEAPQRLAPFVDTKGAGYQSYLNEYAQRAQQHRLLQQQQMLRAGQEADKQRADTEKNWREMVFKPLLAVRQAAPKKVAVKGSDTAALVSGAPKETRDFTSELYDKLGNLKSAIAAAQSLEPGLADAFGSGTGNVFAEARSASGNRPWMASEVLDDAAEDPDPRGAARALDVLAQVIEARMREYMGRTGHYEPQGAGGRQFAEDFTRPGAGEPMLPRTGNGMSLHTRNAQGLGGGG